MATSASTGRYASRSAVYGSNAYDLSHVRGYSREPMAHEKAPVKKPEVKPTVRTAPQTAPQSAARTAHKAQKAYGISLYAVIGFVFVAAMMVFVLLAHVKYNEVTNETVKLQARLDELNSQERKLKIEYENAFDVNDVERYATQVLGMSKPAEDQISTVSATAQDKAIVMKSSDESSEKNESMVTFLASLVAYFK